MDAAMKEPGFRCFLRCCLSAYKNKAVSGRMPNARIAEICLQDWSSPYFPRQKFARRAYDSWKLTCPPSVPEEATAADDIMSSTVDVEMKFDTGSCKLEAEQEAVEPNLDVFECSNRDENLNLREKPAIRNGQVNIDPNLDDSVGSETDDEKPSSEIDCSFVTDIKSSPSPVAIKHEQKTPKCQNKTPKARPPRIDLNDKRIACGIKRARTSFTFYIMDRNMQVRANGKDSFKLFAEQWRTLGPMEKQYYHDKAAADLFRYTTEMQEAVMPENRPPATV
ncbi:unnamed protein product, partial [Mesorhabditis spiculigera]